MSEKQKVIILGAGGFAREVFHAIKNYYEVEAFVADGESGNRDIFGIPVRGKLTEADRSKHFFVAIGDPSAKERVWNRAIAMGLWPSRAFIHPSAVVEDAIIGLGSVILQNSTLTTNVRIGQGVIINLNCTVGHDSIIKSFTTVSPGANISGNVQIGERSYIGTAASIREKIKIGSQCVLGMGAALLKDMRDGEVWGGVPAKPLAVKKAATNKEN